MSIEEYRQLSDDERAEFLIRITSHGWWHIYFIYSENNKCKKNRYQMFAPTAGSTEGITPSTVRAINHSTRRK